MANTKWYHMGGRVAQRWWQKSTGWNIREYHDEPGKFYLCKTGKRGKQVGPFETLDHAKAIYQIVENA